jgi:hypothetical protein
MVHRNHDCACRPHRAAACAFVQKNDFGRVTGPRTDPPVFQVLSEDFKPRHAASHRVSIGHRAS